MLQINSPQKLPKQPQELQALDALQSLYIDDNQRLIVDPYIPTSHTTQHRPLIHLESQQTRMGKHVLEPASGKPTLTQDSQTMMPRHRTWRLRCPLRRQCASFFHF